MMSSMYSHQPKLILPALVFLMTLCGAVLDFPAHADYLEVKRNATIKQLPNRNSRVLIRPEIGSYLELLDGGNQQNGYYRVRAGEIGRTGFIYRTLVRRYRGVIPIIDSDDLSNDASVPRTRPRGQNIVRAHYVDVDQGDATIIEFPCGLIMIDAGAQNEENTDELVQYLNDIFERRPDLQRTIDTVFITHTHVDHNRSLRQIVAHSDFIVKNYVHNGVFRGSGRFAATWMRDHGSDEGRSIVMRPVTQPDISRLSERVGLTEPSIDAVNCDEVDPEVRVLSATYLENPGWSQGHFEDGNNKSLVIRIDYGKSSFLFTGDLEESGIETLVEYYNETNLIDVDVYQVGHHGSYNGTTESLLIAMSPKIAVISMGPSEDTASWTAFQYGHPRKTLVELLDDHIDRRRQETKWVDVASAVRDFSLYKMTDSVFGTGWSGNIVITADADSNFYVESVPH